MKIYYNNVVNKQSSLILRSRSMAIKFVYNGVTYHNDEKKKYLLDPWYVG